MRRTAERLPFRLLDAFLAHAAGAVVLVDAELTYVYVSAGIEELLGYDRDELLGTSARAITHPEDQRAIRPAQDRVIAIPGATAVGRVRLRKKDGEYRWCEATATNHLADPELRGLVVTYREGDPAWTADAQVREVPGGVATALREQRDLIAAIAHAPTLKRVAAFVIHAVQRYPGIDAAGLYVVEPTSGDLVLTESAGLSEAFLDQARRYPGDGKRVAFLKSLGSHHGRSIVRAEADISGEAARDEGIRALSIVSLWDRGRFVGCLNVASRTVHAFSTEGVEAIELLAMVAAEAVGRLDLDRRARDSARRYAALFDSMRQGVLYRDAAGRIIEVNPAACQILGASNDELVGRTLAEAGLALMREDGSTLLAEECPTSVALRMGAPQRRVFVGIKRPDGELRSVLVDAIPYSDDPEDPMNRVQTVLTDVTEQRAAAAALQRKVAEYDALVAAARDGYVVFDDHGIIQDVNPTLCEMLGYERAELVGEKTIKLLDELGDATRTPAARALREHGWARFESTTRNKAGEDVDIEASAWVVPGAGITLAFLRDVREVRRAHALVVEHERRYQSLLRGSLDAFLVVALDGTILEVNDGAGRLFGVPPQELLGRSVGTLDMVLGPDGVRAALGGIRGAGSGRFQTAARRANGEIIHIEVSAWVAGPEGPVLSFVRDLTAQRRAQEELRRSEEQLRQSQKMEAIGRLAGGVAHDFNNLLTVINSCCELALDELHAQDPARAELDEIANAGQRAAALTRQLLTFSRRGVVDPSVVDLSTVLTELHHMLERLIGEDIELVVERVGGDKPLVFADRGQIEQVVLNLVVNSRDAMPSGGNLTLRTAVRRVEAGRVPELEAGVYSVVSVEDTGVGMDPATLDRIFEPFFTTKGHAGTGLGLSTVYGIVKQAKGAVVVRSAVGEGTLIDVLFPIAAEKKDEREVPKIRHSARGRETILLVEDDPAVRQVVRNVLEGAGYRVLAAANGEDAIAACKREAGEIQLLFTDIVMPRMNGREIADAIVALRPKIKVLYASGYADDVLLREGVFGPNADFVPKPFEIAPLRQKIRSLLDS